MTDTLDTLRQQVADLVLDVARAEKRGCGALTDTEHLYIRSMGKALRVLAIFTSDAAANAYMSRHSEAAVVAVLKNGCILLADKHDKGIAIPKGETP